MSIGSIALFTLLVRDDLYHMIFSQRPDDGVPRPSLERTTSCLVL